MRKRSFIVPREQSRPGGCSDKFKGILSRLRLAAVFLLSFIIILTLAGCQSETVSPTPAPETNTSENVGPTATTGPVIVPTEDLSPPPTPSPPPPVVVITEDSNDSGQTDAGTESPPPLPEGLIGPDEFPPNVNPLTGETVSDPAVLARRPLAIKISNAPPIVRPQSGLNNADLIFEHYAEGGLTRFTAVFYGKDANPIGSIRSGRFIDIEIPQMYDAAFAYSGSSGPLQLMFRNGSFFNRIISPDFGHGGFFRVEDPSKAFEHTLFTSSSNLWFILDERDQNTPPVFGSNMAFSQEPLNPGTSASKIEIRYDGTNVTWAYNSGNSRYSRWTDGAPHLDANTGDQLNFKNIIVVGAHHEDTDILEDNVAGGHYSIQIQIWGEGPVSIFRDGQRIEGQWRREQPDHMLTFYDLEGNILPLAPGNSFFQIVPLGFDRLIVTP